MLVYYLRQRKGFLGTPGLLEREWIKHATIVINDALAQYKKAGQTLETIFGLTFVYGLPTESEIDQTARSRFEELEPLLVRVPFTLEHATLALDRVNAGLPPSGEKNQQFKDSAIWEAVLELARTHSVYLITRDGGFYEKNGDALASVLSKECVSEAASVRLFRDISACLKQLKEEKDVNFVDLKHLADSIENIVGLFHCWLLVSEERGGFLFTDERVDAKATAYLTGEPDKLAISFKLTYRLEDRSENQSDVRLEPSLTLIGDCFFNVRTKEVRRTQGYSELQVTFGTLQAWSCHSLHSI